MFARPMRILLVEDDAMLGAAVRSALAKAGHAVDWVQAGSAADLAVAGWVSAQLMKVGFAPIELMISPYMGLPTTRTLRPLRSSGLMSGRLLLLICR
jgi:two-component system OmpR family response regulator